MPDRYEQQGATNESEHPFKLLPARRKPSYQFQYRSVPNGSPPSHRPIASPTGSCCVARSGVGGWSNTTLLSTDCRRALTASRRRRSDRTSGALSTRDLGTGSLSLLYVGVGVDRLLSAEGSLRSFTYRPLREGCSARRCCRAVAVHVLLPQAVEDDGLPTQLPVRRSSPRIRHGVPRSVSLIDPERIGRGSGRQNPGGLIHG